MLVTSCRSTQTTIGVLLLITETMQGGCLTPAYCHRVLQKSNGGGVAISSLEKKKPVVLFFYPKVGTCCSLLSILPSARSVRHALGACAISLC